MPKPIITVYERKGTPIYCEIRGVRHDFDLLEEYDMPEGVSKEYTTSHRWTNSKGEQCYIDVWRRQNRNKNDVWDGTWYYWVDISCEGHYNSYKPTWKSLRSIQIADE